MILRQVRAAGDSRVAVVLATVEDEFLQTPKISLSRYATFDSALGPMRANRSPYVTLAQVFWVIFQ